MGNDEIPTLDVELGLSPNAEPSLSALFQRCRERLKLLASGRAELSHLLDEGVCRRRLNIDPPCRLNIDPGRVAAF